MLSASIAADTRPRTTAGPTSAAQSADPPTTSSTISLTVGRHKSGPSNSGDYISNELIQCADLHTEDVGGDHAAANSIAEGQSEKDTMTTKTRTP